MRPAAGCAGVDKGAALRYHPASSAKEVSCLPGFGSCGMLWRATCGTRGRGGWASPSCGPSATFQERACSSMRFANGGCCSFLDAPSRSWCCSLPPGLCAGCPSALRARGRSASGWLRLWGSSASGTAGTGFSFLSAMRLSGRRMRDSLRCGTALSAGCGRWTSWCALPWRRSALPLSTARCCCCPTRLRARSWCCCRLPRRRCCAGPCP